LPWAQSRCARLESAGASRARAETRGRKTAGASRTRVETARTDRRRHRAARPRFLRERAPAGFDGAGPFRASGVPAVGTYGFFVGRGGTVGIGVRPTGGGVANGFGLGDSEGFGAKPHIRSEEHTSELQSRSDLVC